MNIWMAVRVALAAFALLLTAFYSPAQPEGHETPWFFVVFTFFFGIIAMLFVVGMQRLNPWTAKEWRYPSWTLNPFQLREPLLFFHFGAYFMLASGIGLLINQVTHGLPITGTSLIQLVFGAGILAGVKVCTLVYKDKMVLANDSTQ